MTLVHEEIADGVHYRVQDGETGRELWIDDVLHSRASDAHFSGTLWETLALPALLTARPVDSVLVLGLGGGAVVHTLRRLVSPARIVAIELDPVVARIAHEHFDVAGPDLEVRLGDAFDYVRGDEIESFDVVLDDVFGQREGLPLRDERLDGEWWPAVGALVAPGGALVVDFGDGGDLVGSSLCQNVGLRWLFPEAWVAWGEEHENAVACLLREPLTDTPEALLGAHAPIGEAAGRAAFERLWPTS